MKYLHPQINNLTVLTNNLDVINYISDHRPDIDLLIIGNLYNNSTRSFVGNDTISIIEKYNINKAFMAATAVSIQNGVTNSDIKEFDIKKKIVEKSKFVYILVDESKFGQSTLLTYAKLSDINGVITSKEPSKEYFKNMYVFFSL